MRSVVLVVAVTTRVVTACSSSESSPPVAETGNDTAASDADDTADATPPPRCLTVKAPTIETIGVLGVGRYSPLGVVLADGRALVGAGFDFGKGTQSSTEIFDPASGALSAGPSLVRARNFPAWSLLDDGRLLVAGGFHQSGGSLTAAEVLSIVDFTSTATAVMSVPREAHTASRLPDGRVLVTGGLKATGFVFHSSAEIWDPSSGAWSSAGTMASPRAFHVALEEGGKVFVAGGDSGAGELSTAERFDPASGAWTMSGASLPKKSKALALAKLSVGRALIAGGANATDGTLAEATIYDAKTDTATPTASMATRRIAFTLTTLGDGRVLAIGGFSDSSTPRASSPVLELYDTGSGTWQTLPTKLAQARHDHVAVLLPDCRVLVAGGQQVIGTASPTAPREVELITIPYLTR